MNDKETSQSSTHFGFQQVDVKAKENLVRDVFDSVADQYDVMNDVMSLGLHRLWKKITTTVANIQPHYQILDLAAGTGDLSLQMAPRLGKNGHITLADINYNMLARGRDRMVDANLYQNVSYTLANAESLPFNNNHFNIITIAFGLRNVTRKERALKEMYRVLKPGGQCLILEFSKPLNKFLHKIYDSYSFNFIPKFGKLIANDADSYQYLVESIRKHPEQSKLKEMLATSGFDEVKVHNFLNGIVALHRSYKY